MSNPDPQILERLAELERRVAALENQLAQLVVRIGSPPVQTA